MLASTDPSRRDRGLLLVLHYALGTPIGRNVSLHIDSSEQALEEVWARRRREQEDRGTIYSDVSLPSPPLPPPEPEPEPVTALAPALPPPPIVMTGIHTARIPKTQRTYGSGHVIDVEDVTND
jgi:hypothetical protein